MRKRALFSATAAIAAIAAVVLCVFCLSGCILDTGGGMETETIVESLPQNLDPQLNISAIGEKVIEKMFKRLVAVEEGKIVLSAAESYTVSGDRTEYLFTIRERESWTDGEAVTAQDYAFAFSRIADPSSYSPYAERFSGIESVNAEDARTLRIRLKSPDNRFLYFMASAAASPCREDFFLSTHGRYGLLRETLIGNGDWQLTTWLMDTGTLRLSGKTSGNEEGHSILYRLPKEGEPLSAETRERVYGLTFREDGTFGSESARKAVLLDLPAEYHDSPAGFTPESDAGLSFPAANPSLARLLYRAAVTETDQARLVLLVSEESGLYDRVAALSQIWQQDIGLFFSIEVIPETEVISRMETGDYDAALVSLGNGCGEPFGELELFAEYAGEEFSDLYDQAVQAPEEQAGALYAECERKAFENGLFIPLFQTEGET